MPIAGISAHRVVATAAVLTAVSAACSFVQAAGVAGKQLAAPPTGLQSINMPATLGLPAPTAAQISMWINELKGDNSRAQKYANQHLIEAGDAATRLLTAAQSGAASKPVARRLRHVLHAIALADALHGPLITLRCKSCTLRSLLTSVCASSGMWCQLPRNCKRLSERFEVNIQRQLFWNVLLRIAKATGISPSQGDPHSLLFSRRGLFSNGARVAVNGAFAVVIESASLKSTKQRTKSVKKDYDCQLDCNTLWVPTNKAFVQIGSLKAVSASGRKGRKLTVSGSAIPTSYYDMPIGQIISGETLTIGPIARTSHEIFRLALNIPVAVSMNLEIQSANNLNSGRAEIDAYGMRFMFGRPRPAKRQWGVSMNIITPPWQEKSLPVRAFLSRMDVFSPGPFTFTNTHGNPIGHPTGFGHGYVTKAQYEFFPLASKPTGVLVKTYTRMVAVDVPFVFKHTSIPLSTKSSSLPQATQPAIVTLQDIKVRSQPPVPAVLRQVVMPAQSHSTAATPSRVTSWIHDLGSQNPSVRAAAMKQLSVAGDAADPAIKTALNGWTTPQTRQDMRDVLNKIAQDDTVRGPLVSLKLTNAPLRRILKRLCAQVGFSAQFVDLHLAMAARRLTVNVQRQPFWKVIQRIAMVTDVSPEGNDSWGAGFLTFYQPGAFAKGTPVYTHGALLLAVQNSSTYQTIRFDGGRGHRTVGGFGLSITGLWALGNSQVARLGPARFSRAVDNHGRSLLASAKASVEAAVSAVKYEFSFGPHLIWPHPDSTTIRTLNGELPMTLAVTPHIRHIRNLDSGHAVIRISDLRISWGKRTGVVQNPLNPRLDRCTVHITVAPDANAASMPMTEFFMQSLPQGKSFAYTPSIGGVLGFKSKSGRQLPCRVGKQTGGSPWSYQVHVRGGLPVTAWAKVYTRFVHVDIPFSFHNLPIPGGSGVVLKPMVGPKIRNRPVANPGRLIMLGGPHPTAIQAGQVAQWIRQLTGPSIARRRTAAHHLILAGNAAILPLQKALGHAADPAQRQELLSILDSIAAADDLRGPLVSLNLQHASVRAALEQLCSQVGISAYYDQLPPSPLATYRIRRQPFWMVLRHIAAMSHIGPVGNNYSNNRPRFGHGTLFASDVPVVIDSACALAIQSIRRYQNLWQVRVDPTNKKRNFAASCFVLWAPTTNEILEQVGTLHATEIITDSRGKVLLAAPVKNTNNAWPSKQENLIFPLNIQLHWPPARGAALALRGNLRMYLSSDMRTLRITKLGFGHATLTDDGMNLVFGKLHKIPGGWKLHLYVRPVQGFFYHGKTSHWLPFAQMPIESRFTHNLCGGKELRLYSADGHRLRITAHHGGLLAKRGWGYYRYTLNLDGAAPTSATIKFFTRTVLVKVPFDFKNLPIPR